MAQSSDPSARARSAGTTQRARIRRFTVVAGVLGGLVGGGVVAAIGGAAGWGDHDHVASRTCAVDRVADKALPSVVTLSVEGSNGGGTGSGVVYRLNSGKEVIVTNAHVVIPPNSNGSTANARVRILYTDGHTSAGTIQGTDVVTDLAVVTASAPSRDAPPIHVGESGELRVGKQVVALGAPLGLSSTVTTGIVSATGRYIRVPTENGAAHLVGAIQTDASINPGNSGGALVDCNAHLIGINSAGASPGQESGSSGLGFAIPTSLAAPLIEELAEHGRISHPTLGMLVQSVPSTMQGSAGGAVVVDDLAPGGPAAKAGITRGDVVTEIDGRPVRDPEDLVQAELNLKVGEKVDVTVVRNGQKKSLTLQAASS